eukprot:120728_1
MAGMNIDNECSLHLGYINWNWNNVNGECILFEQWKLMQTTDYIASSMILFLICLLREYVIYLTEYYGIIALTGRYIPFWPNTNQLDERMPINIKPSVTTIVIPHNHWRNTLTLKIRTIDCVLYGMSLLMGYGLMLVICSFNIVFIIVIVTGYCLGRLIFYKRRQLLLKFAIRHESVFGKSDHCHIRS